MGPRSLHVQTVALPSHNFQEDAFLIEWEPNKKKKCSSLTRSGKGSSISFNDYAYIYLLLLLVIYEELGYLQDIGPTQQILHHPGLAWQILICIGGPSHLNSVLMVAKLNAEPEPASFRFVPNANLIIANLEIKIKKKISPGSSLSATY